MDSYWTRCKVERKPCRCIRITLAAPENYSYVQQCEDHIDSSLNEGDFDEY